MEYRVVDSHQQNGTLFEVLEYPSLAGAPDAATAESLYFLREAGVRPKSIRVTLTGGKMRAEPGALYHMQGQLEMKASTGGGIMRALSRKVTSGETFFVNEIHGRGQVYLEPSYGHFLLLTLDNEEIIVDKGMFYAGAGELSVSGIMQKSIGAGAMGGEGWWQTKIAGTGVVALFSPVPAAEIETRELNDEKLVVDGNFAILRSGGVAFKVEKSSKSWLATSVSGEGLVATFTGTGKVWLAPTLPIYHRLKNGGFADMAVAGSARTNNG